MENITQANNAAASVRSRAPFAGVIRWQRMPQTVVAGHQPPTATRVRSTILPAGTYLVTDLRPTTDSAVRFSCTGADHKFSTRLGPSASPPV
jgi:hypothetical protein